MRADAQPCQHPRVSQLSIVHARTYWNREDDGSYEPEPTGPICLSKILSEETESWRCVDCGADVEIHRYEPVPEGRH
jgi:hypothetical protein